jgi:uncharacterized protein YndB with AHSA1/START domain
MATQDKNEVTITRIFDAPRELVWKAWTDPEIFKRWWGPEGFTSPVAKIDLRVGGKFDGSMRSPDGHDFWGTGVYREIVPPERLVMTDSFADEQGNVVPATHYGFDADFPRELLITVILEKHEGKTKLTLKHSGVGRVDDKHRNDMEQGWRQSFNKLEKVLESEKGKAQSSSGGAGRGRDSTHAPESDKSKVPEKMK